MRNVYPYMSLDPVILPSRDSVRFDPERPRSMPMLPLISDNHKPVAAAAVLEQLHVSVAVLERLHVPVAALGQPPKAFALITGSLQVFTSQNTSFIASFAYVSAKPATSGQTTKLTY